MKRKTLQTKLEEKLARSLDKANTLEATKRPGRQRPLVPAPMDKRCTKISISLFDTDTQRVQAIRAYVLTQRGESISTSQVIKLALRTAPLSADLCKALDAAAAEDGRKW